MGKTADILNTKTVTYKDQLLIAALSAAIAAAVSVPFALAANEGHASANSPVSAAQLAGPSCTEALGSSSVSTSAAKPASHVSTVTSTGNTNTQSGNSGNGSANNTTGGSSAANGNTQTNTGGLIGGVNAIVPISALNNNNVANGNNVLSGNDVNVLNNVSTKVPVVTGILSNVGVQL